MHSVSKKKGNYRIDARAWILKCHDHYTRGLENDEETKSRIGIDPWYRFETECSYHEKKIWVLSI